MKSKKEQVSEVREIIKGTIGKRKYKVTRSTRRNGAYSNNFKVIVRKDKHIEFKKILLNTIIKYLKMNNFEYNKAGDTNSPVAFKLETFCTVEFEEFNNSTCIIKLIFSYK